MSDTTQDLTSLPGSDKDDISECRPAGSIIIQTSVERPRGTFFWVTLFTICLCALSSGLALTCLSTALPIVVEDLNGTEFVWATSAYMLTCTAFIPMSGNIAEVFGRPPAILLSLGIFSLGSVLCGCARNVSWLVASRAVQGIGGGGLLLFPPIVLADLVTLKERGVYAGILNMTYVTSAAIGPILGGALAKAGAWRWIFFMNIPLCTIITVFVALYIRLKLPTPSGHVLQKLMRLDWFGGFFTTASAISCGVAFTWAGIKFPWISVQVQLPLILGFYGLVMVTIFCGRVSAHPVIPICSLSNLTSVSGYMQRFLSSLLLFATIYYGPIYYQVCSNIPLARSGIDTLPISLSLGLVAVISGLSVALIRSYRIPCYAGWAICLAGCGLMPLIPIDQPAAYSICVSALIGVGLGALHTVMVFPVLAALPVTENAGSLTVYSFVQSVGGFLGVSMGGTILEARLKQRLPTELVEASKSSPLFYDVMATIHALEEPAQATVRSAFAESYSAVWRAMLGVAVVGLLSCALMRAKPLKTDVDEKWTIRHDSQSE